MSRLRRRVTCLWGTAVLFAGGTAGLLILPARQASLADGKSGPLVRAMAFTESLPVVFPGSKPVPADGFSLSIKPSGVPLRVHLSDLMLDLQDPVSIDQMVGKWAVERDEAAWRQGAMEMGALVRERPGHKSARYWRAWCAALLSLPPQQLYDHLAANSRSLIPLLAVAGPVDEVRPLRSLTRTLVDAFDSQGQLSALERQLPGAPPDLRALLEAALAGRYAAMGDYARLDAVPAKLRRHAELETLSRLSGANIERMVDFVLTHPTTFTPTDSEAAASGLRIAILPGHEALAAHVLAAPPSTGRDLLLYYAVTSRWRTTTADAAMLAAAITDDALRATTQKSLQRGAIYPADFESRPRNPGRDDEPSPP